MTKFKKGLCIALAIIIGVVAFGSVVTFAKNDTKSAGAIFKIGGLDENGEYVSNNQSIYTKDLIECHGLTITPDFESSVTFSVFFYDEDGKFLFADENLSKIYKNDFELAKYCRIVITPNIPEDVDDEEFEVGLLEVYKYASMLDITVAKDENEVLLYGNFYNEELIVFNKALVSSSNDPTGSAVDNIYDANLIDNDDFNVSNIVNLKSNCDKIYLYIQQDYPPDSYITWVFADENGNRVGSGGVYGGGNFYCGNIYRKIITIPEGATMMRIASQIDVENVYIYQVND